MAYKFNCYNEAEGLNITHSQRLKTVVMLCLDLVQDRNVVNTHHK